MPVHVRIGVYFLASAAAAPLCAPLLGDASLGACGDPDAGDCFSSNGTPYCADANCCQTICAFEPYCCQVVWDTGCARRAVKKCGGDFQPPAQAACPGPDDCFMPHGTPGCDDQACCELVCFLDPGCCSGSWSALCAGWAAAFCENGSAPQHPSCPADQSCCDRHELPGCDDADCCNLVCLVEPDCCDDDWENICARLACELCGCPPPANDDCHNALPLPVGDTLFATTGATWQDLPYPPGCGVDPGNTTIARDIWYSLTATQTGTLSLVTCNPKTSFSTRIAVYSGGCESLALVACDVFHPIFCSGSVLMFEVDEAADYLIRIGGVSTAQVGTWSGTGLVSVQYGEGFPISCGNPIAGDCFTPNYTPYCRVDDCCQSVCAMDPFCCNVQWSTDCADLALQICEPPVVPAHDDCADSIQLFTDVPHVGSSADATGVNTTSCSFQNVHDVWHSWTADCTGDATISLCGSSFDTALAVFDACGGTEIGCNDDTEQPGCALQSQTQVPVTAGTTIAIRVAGTAWATGPYTLSVSCDPAPPVPGDVDGDGTVGILDFLAVLANWGPCPDCGNCPADFDGDCAVGITDFLIVLSNWG